MGGCFSALNEMTHAKCLSSADTEGQSLGVWGDPHLVSVFTVIVLLSLQVRTPGLGLGDALVPSHLSTPACLLLSQVKPVWASTCLCILVMAAACV